MPDMIPLATARDAGGTLGQALTVSAYGMAAQQVRLRVVAENLANQDTTGSTPGAHAYRRKLTFMVNRPDPPGGGDAASEAGVSLLRVSEVRQDMSPMPSRYDPDNPAANQAGYVELPNVNSFVEIMDMKEAQRAYDADLNVMQTARTMLSRTIDLLK